MKKDKPSLLIIGNSNVGKSTITKLLLPHPKQYKGKIGKKPGSTLLIKPINQRDLPYKIVDLPGFGYMKAPSRRREEHIKNQIVQHIERKHSEYFFALVILNILRIEDELTKYFYKRQITIPLSFELVTFLLEFEIPLLVLINKIDKVSTFDQKRIINLLVDTAFRYNLNLVHFDDFDFNDPVGIPYLETSATKRENIGKLKQIIHFFLSPQK